MKKVLIDNGHGTKTAGKRSPDGKLMEGAYARRVARQLKAMLEDVDIPCALLVPEDDDVPLAKRVREANKIHREHRDGTVLVSLHSDAYVGTGWHSSRGMSVRVSLNASQNSKTLARCLYTSFADQGLRTRKYNGDVQPWWPQNLAICRDTNMPAVLVEMFFHDNKEDVAFALSDEGFDTICTALFEGIIKFLK